MKLFTGFLLALFVAYCAASDCTENHHYFSDHESGRFGCDSYNDRINVTWLITLPNPGERILMTFDSFNTEANYDFIRIYDGADKSSRLMGAFSGSVIPGPFSSSGNSMFLMFVTDEYVEGTGFSAHWTAFQMASGVSRCTVADVTELAGSDGSFGCDGYDDKLEKAWHIVGNHGERVVLSFETFDTERDYDFVKIYDGPSVSSELIATFSGSSVPPPVTATSNELFVQLTSDYSLNKAGFIASWSSLVQFADPCYNSTSQVLVPYEGYIGCPYGYGNNVHSSWLIAVVGDYIIQVDFLSLNLEASKDFVDVYDGGNENSTKLGTYTGLQTPQPIHSSGNLLLVVLRTDNKNTAGGFTASYQSVHAVQEAGCSVSGSYVLTAAEDSIGCDGYGNNVTQEWRLVAQSDHEVINLVWRTFNTESGHDVLFVYDGANASMPLLYRISGNTLPDPVTSSGRTLYIRFVADANNIQGEGFFGLYESITPVPQVDATNCQSSHSNHLTAESGTFGCSRYENNVVVSWQIEVSESHLILLDFDSFFTEAGYDILTVYDGPTADANVLGSFSGVLRPASLSSSSKYLYLVFSSDAAVTRSGFTARYSSVYRGNDANACFEDAVHVLTDDDGSFGCSGYGGNVHTSWAITTAVGTFINLDFSSFQTEFNYDVVRIYDGANTQARLLATYSGYVVPEPLRSSANKLFVEFTSDESINYDGFVANYHSEETAANEVPRCSKSTSQTITEPSGQFGCGGYDSNVDSSWYINLVPGSRITLHFSSLDTEQFYDYIKIYDGSSKSAPIIGTYSGQILPSGFTSSSSQLYVTFHSDSSDSNYNGFVIEYTSYAVDEDDGSCSTSTSHFLTNNTGEFGCNGYAGNVVVSWNISSSYGNVFVNFVHFSTETNYDTLSIYDGPNDRSEVLAVYSGNTAPPVTSTGHNMYLVFRSDDSVNRRGFQARYAIAARDHPRPSPPPRPSRNADIE